MIDDQINHTGDNGSMPQVTSVVHPALGQMIRLDGTGAPPLRLTPAEARTIALALRAIRDGRAAEQEIFLSPIASDDVFAAQVGPDGVRCPRALDWDQVEHLAGRLLAMADGAP